MPGERRGPVEFYSGRELEIDVFGKPKFPHAFDRIIREADRGYLPFQRAQDLIREHYPGDPTNPEKEFANDIRLEVVEQLDLGDEGSDDVKFYSAVGTPLDLYHGVDAWIEIALQDEQSGRTIRAQVTLDVTQRTEKQEEGHKADIIIGDVPDPSAKNYLSEVSRYGEEIGTLLVERLQSELRRARQTGRASAYRAK
jgi:hypothetical protein